MSTFRLLIVAGERSGDLYGARLARCLQEKTGAVALFGCGGREMRAAGVETVVDTNEVTMVGITEVIPGLPRLIRAFRRLLRQTELRRARAAILIDFPDFNLRLAKKLKRRGIPVVYFVSPQVWAWRKGRVRVLRKTVRKMICIFPFEESIYSRGGVDVDYVGHPLVDTVVASHGREEWFARLQLDPNAATVALLPGSRQREVLHNLPPMLEAASRLALSRKIQFLLPVARTLQVPWMERVVSSANRTGVRVRLVGDGGYDVVKHSDVAVVASGTATVETCLLGRPMVVVYRVSPLTWRVGKLLVRVPFYAMVNLIAGRSVVPELIQKDFTGPRLAAEVETLLDNRKVRERMIRELGEVRTALGRPGAIERAAEVILRTLNIPRMRQSPLYAAGSR